MTGGGPRLHAQTVVTLVAVRLGLPRLGVERTLRLAVRLGHDAAHGDRDRRRVVRAVRRVANHLVPGAACLAQSITVLALLSARGASPELVLGCRLTGEDWVAHAWVDCDGECLEPVLGGTHVELARYRRHDGWALRPSGTSEQEARRTDDASS